MHFFALSQPAQNWPYFSGSDDSIPIRYTIRV